MCAHYTTHTCHHAPLSSLLCLRTASLWTKVSLLLRAILGNQALLFPLWQSFVQLQSICSHTHTGTHTPTHHQRLLHCHTVQYVHTFWYASVYCKFSPPCAHTNTHTQTHSSQVKLQPFSNQETSTGTIMVNFSPKPAGRYFRTAGASQAKRNDFPQDFWISFAIRHKLIRSDMISSTIRKQLPSNSVGRGNPCKWIAANCALQRCMITVLYKKF